MNVLFLVYLSYLQWNKPTVITVLFLSLCDLRLFLYIGKTT